MGEVVNVLVAFAVIVFIFRWVTSSACLAFKLSLLQLQAWDVGGVDALAIQLSNLEPL